jgi:AmiR/NasT family two-component response regulator
VEEFQQPSPGADTELGRLTLYADAQERRVSELQKKVAELEHALASRVVIERAIGMLAERFDLSVVQAFELLRSAARASRRQVRSLAEEITELRGVTPGEVAEARRRGQSA